MQYEFKWRKYWAVYYRRKKHVEVSKVMCSFVCVKQNKSLSCKIDTYDKQNEKKSEKSSIERERKAHNSLSIKLELCSNLCKFIATFLFLFGSHSLLSCFYSSYLFLFLFCSLSTSMFRPRKMVRQSSVCFPKQKRKTLDICFVS